ncbi:basic proline-rich protein-like [Panthera uncia]|uniref:basic proline-rich protein-like n=1 Tax=Panthera uncia TaxID=29064 RepID=UPI0020FFCC63|nr:basic proline-rich protein-like [Panthera uncia]
MTHGGLTASPALCQDLPPSPLTAPNAEPPPSEPGSRSINPAPAPRPQRPAATVRSGPRRPLPGPGLRARQRRPGAQSPAAPARDSAPSPPLAPPGPGARHRLPSQRARCRGPGSRSPPSPPLPALHPRRLLRSGRCEGSFPLLAGARLQHRAPLPQPAAAAANPPRHSLPGRSWGRREGLGRPQPPPPPPARPRRLRWRLRPLRPRSRPRGERSQAPGSRRFPARHAQQARPRREGARARGRRAGGGHAPPARARGRGRGFRRAEEGAGERAEFPSNPAPCGRAGPVPPSSPGGSQTSEGNLPPSGWSLTLAAGGRGAFQFHRYVRGSRILGTT